MAGLLWLLPAALWIAVCLCDADGPPCLNRIQKRVGDTVEIPTCLSQNISDAYWKYNGTKILNNHHVMVESLKDRLRMDNTTFNLILSDLTLQDSGKYGFIAWKDSTQHPTIFTCLEVYEAIAGVEVRRLNSTWDTAANKCATWYECGAAHSDSGTDYTWSIGNDTYSGAARENVSHAADDIVTCTASNPVSEESASVQAECSNSAPNEGYESYLWMELGGLALALALVLVLALACCMKKRKAATVESYYDTVVPVGRQNTASKDECPLYDTVNDTELRPTPTTIYYTVQQCKNVSSS